MVEGKAGAGGRAGCGSDEGRRRRFRFRMSENSLNLCLVSATAGGLALGWHIRHHGVSGRLLKLMDFPGELYMRMLECLAMPVVTSSIVAGLGSVDILLAGNIGLIAMLYFVLATVMASAIGIGVALLLGPQREACWRRQRLTHVDGFLDLLRNLFPDNYLAACLQTTVTVPQNMTDEAPFKTVSESRANILGLLSVSVMLGAVLSATVNESDALLNLFVGLSNATVTVSHLTAWFSPVGVFFLVATRLTQLRDLDRAYGAARSFLHVTLAGLAAYGLGLLPALYMLTTRQDPRHFLRITFAPAMKAFRSASRTVSVPGTIEALEDLAGLEPRIVRFVIPVGANVSMSGTALVAAATAVILARLDGLEVGLEELLIIGTTVVLASLGAASIPNSSVLTILMILMALQVSSRDISLVFALDWAIDRFRTTVNIYSDSVCSAIVQQFGRLEPIDGSQDGSHDEPAPVPPLQPRRSTTTGSEPETPPEAGAETNIPNNCEEPHTPNSWQRSRQASQSSSFSAQTTSRRPSSGHTEQWTLSSCSATTSPKVPPTSTAPAPGASGPSSPNEAASITEAVAQLGRQSPVAVTTGSSASSQVCAQPPPLAGTPFERHQPLEVAPSVAMATSTTSTPTPRLADASEATVSSFHQSPKSSCRQASLVPVSAVDKLEAMNFWLAETEVSDTAACRGGATG